MPPNKLALTACQLLQILLITLLSIQLSTACRQQQLVDDGQSWTAEDCGNFSIWDVEKKACRCDEGWKGNRCNVWANSTCYYQVGFKYRGYLNNTDAGACLPWKEIPGPFTTEEGNYCRNPDQDSNGIWCYVKSRDSAFGQQKPEYCQAYECEKVVVNYLRNGTNGLTSFEMDNDLEILYGPIIGGICGGLVALMTIVGFFEYLRRRRTFHKLRLRFDPEYAAEQSAVKADRRKLGAINVVNIDTGEVEVQKGFTAGGQVRLDKGEMSQLGDGGKSRVGGTTIGARSMMGAQSTVLRGGMSQIAASEFTTMSKGPAINRIISHENPDGGLGRSQHGGFDAQSQQLPEESQHGGAQQPGGPEMGTSFGQDPVPQKNLNVDELSDYAGGDENDDREVGMMKFRKRKTIDEDEDYDEPRNLQEREYDVPIRQRVPSRDKKRRESPGRERRRGGNSDRREQRKRRDSREEKRRDGGGGGDRSGGGGRRRDDRDRRRDDRDYDKKDARDRRETNRDHYSSDEDDRKPRRDRSERERPGRRRRSREGDGGGGRRRSRERR